MRVHRILTVVALTVVAALVAVPVTAQQVAKRTAKRAAKEATESAAKDAAEDAAKKAIKKAAAPDAVDLNAATPEQLAKLGLDQATAKKVVESRPFSSMDDPKLKDAIPADALAKLQGKVTVKPASGEAKPADQAAPSGAEPVKPPSDSTTPPSR